MQHKARGSLTAGRGIAFGLLAWLASAAFAVAAPTAGQTGAAPAADQAPVAERPGAGADIAAQLAAAHLAEPLVATGPTTPAEDDALARAVAAYERRAHPDDFSSLTGFLSAYPKSAWRPAVLTDLGIDYLHYGYFSRALDAWQTAWRDGKDATEFRAKALVDRAVGELVQLDAGFGFRDRLKAVLSEIGDRPISGPATEMVLNGRETATIMQIDPKHLYLCGPRALKALMLSRHASLDQVRFLNKVRAGPKGTSLAEVGQLATQANAALDPVFRKPGEKVPVPSIVHWKIGHFAAIVSERNGRYEVQDPTLGHQSLWLSRAAIDAEASGYFLAPATAAQSAPWRKVATGEAGQVWGAGGRGAYANPGSGGGSGSYGMTTYRINEETVALGLIDTPAGYAPPKGPPVAVTLFYDSYDASQPANFGYFNVSQKWSLSWLGFVQDDPTAPGANVQRYDRNNGFLYPQTGFDGHSFTSEEDDASVLTLKSKSPIAYQRLLRDGTTEIYAELDGTAAFPRHVFLSKVIDPQGNAVSLGYGKVNEQIRLISLTDATGRKTSFGYGKSGFPLLITKITDPFGRSAGLSYDSSGRLSAITDVLGLTSRFTYDSASLVVSLATPYGTTRFALGMATGPGGAGDRRFLNIIDPLGLGEREETFEPASAVPFSDPPAQVPQGMPVPSFNQYLTYRNSFHWNKHQYSVGHCTAAGGCDYADARIIHFTHDGDDTSVRGEAAESFKQPLEGRVWFTYPGQPSSGLMAGQSGSYDMPTGIGRVLDSGVTQLTLLDYNSVGNPTQYSDPARRQTELAYAKNQIDVASIAQAIGSGAATIAKFTYNSQHRPLTYTDAAGKVTHYTYNAAGQLTSGTNALGQKTSYSYNSLGYPTTVVNADDKTAARYTYDSAGRVASYTDSEGWTVKYDYDAADRLTKATYLDGTTEAYTYNKLDLASMTDRRGRVWSYTHDADRRLTSVTDPLGHKTSYAYFEDGSLKSVTDPDSHITSWAVDVDSRPTVKTYADGTKSTFQYEQRTNRLKSSTDALGQSRSYAYGLDNLIAQISYPNALNLTPAASFTYDPDFPRLTAMADGTGTTRYSYVPVGSPGALALAEARGPLPNSAVDYAYDAIGRVVKRAVGGAPSETFQYDAIGRLAGHADALGKFSFAYLGETGQVLSRILSGGSVATAWSYLSNTGDRRLASIDNKHTGERLFDYTTTAEDLITQIKENKGASLLQSWSLTYDKENRLLTAGSSSGAKFGYTLDAAGNITKLAGPSGTAALNVNKVNALTNAGYTYDADGELLSDGARTYSWDAENWLIGIGYTSHPGQKTRFTYDGLDRRVTITDVSPSGTTATTDYLWCGTRICQSRSGKATVNRLYYPEGETTPSSKALFYYGPDQLGSVRDVFATSPVFSMVQAYDYDPYGNATKTPASGPFTDFRYAGMLLHGASGLYLTQFRVYDPGIGRWLSRDPLGEFRAQRISAEMMPSALALADLHPETLVTRQQSVLAAGALLSAFRGYGFAPFGDITQMSANQPLTDFRTAGMVDPGALGSNAVQARAADPRAAHLPSLGPIDETGGQSLYAYVDGNPISAVDLAGLGQAPPKPLPWPGGNWDPFNWPQAWQNQWNQWMCGLGDQWNQFWQNTWNSFQQFNAAHQLENASSASSSSSGH